MTDSPTPQRPTPQTLRELIIDTFTPPSPREPDDLISRKAAIEAVTKNRDSVAATRESQWAGSETWHRAGSETWHLNDAAVGGLDRAIVTLMNLPALANLPTLPAQPEKCHHHFQCGTCFELDNIECSKCGETQ
jgi:hypothetical protein